MIRKKKTKEKKKKIITKPTKKNFKKDCDSIIEIFQKHRSFKKEIMLILEIIICQREIEA